ncbi:MAG TPA: Gfo/Idh/MocA family oxidoreductase [Bauldia sp.]|nr:Gfo/Idh/MocA family oxidoreductase [Bauldia sp.]
MVARAAVGIIGCGNISEAYLRLAPLFNNVEIVAVADIAPAAAEARAKQFNVRALKVDELLKADDIEVVVNLTIPDVHYDVTRSILSAGKHAYTEKPLALNYKDASKLVKEADKRGLKIGSAPDTFLGAGMQTVRQLIDKGAIGKVVGGSAYVLSHGMEAWHPNPGFFFRPGAGPIFDIGVYYITALVSLLGPVASVTAMASMGSPTRLVTAEGPMKNKKIKVTTPTNINAILEFANGAHITLGASWDVWKHGHSNPIELYGSAGSMMVPDPNFFSGPISYSEGAGEYVTVDPSGNPFGAANWPAAGPFTRANYRMLGVSDLVDAARSKREPRCSGRIAAHVVEVMEGILSAAGKRSFVAIKSTIERPAPVTAAFARKISAAPVAAAA